MATVIIQDPITGNQARVISGVLQTSGSGGGGTNVNIHDSSGNSLTSTSGALNVFFNAGWSTFGSSTPKQVAVSTTSTTLLVANLSRLFARIVNNSVQTIYVQYGVSAVWQQGFPLRPNAMYVIDTSELFLGQINAITNTGSVNIDVIEGTP